MNNTDTSAAALASTPVKELARRVVKALTDGGAMTADECALHMGEDKLAIRPRVSELNKARTIVDTGERRKNVSGKNAIVWAIRF